MDNSVVLQLDPSESNPRNSEGAFVDLADGRIMFAYSRFFGGHDDDAAGEIVARFSSDKGKTWSDEDITIIPIGDAQNLMSVSFMHMQDGSIGLFYCHRNSKHDCRARLSRSYDQGKTWSTPELVVQAPGYFVLNNDRVIRLKSGRIVVPVCMHRMLKEDDRRGNFDNFDARGIITYYLSDDDGKTWRESADWWGPQMISSVTMQEPGVIQLDDGRLWSWCRTNMGQQYSLFSYDDGEHWTPPVPSNIYSPCSPASVKQIPSTGDLLMIWNDHERSPWVDELNIEPLPPLSPRVGSGQRSPLVAGISKDQGKYWLQRRCIEASPDHGFCYTAIHFVEDSVLLAYCAGGQEETNGLLNRLRMRRVSLDWLYKAPK